MTQNNTTAVIDFSDLIADHAKDFTGREWVCAKIDACLANANGARNFFLIYRHAGHGQVSHRGANGADPR